MVGAGQLRACTPDSAGTSFAWDAIFFMYYMSEVRNMGILVMV